MALLRPLRALRAFGPRRLVQSLDLGDASLALPPPHALEEAQRGVLAQAQTQTRTLYPTQIQTQDENSLHVATSLLASYLHAPLLLRPSLNPAPTSSYLPVTASCPVRGFSDVAASPEPGQGEDPPPAQRTELFVGNLRWNLNDEELANVFSGCEGFVSVRVQRNGPTGKCKGFGFVQFETKEAAQKAMTEMEGAEINGRSIIVEFAQGRVPSNVVYVRSLAWATTSEGLESAFAQCGEIEYSRVLTHRETGRSRGSGVVVFKSVEGAQRAVESMPGQVLDGRTIRVEFATAAQVARAERDREEGLNAAASAGASMQESAGESEAGAEVSTGVWGEAQETEGEVGESSFGEAVAEEASEASEASLATSAETSEAPETPETSVAPDTPESSETPGTPEQAPETSEGPGAGGQASPALSAAQ